ncbi:major facilitator superfamily domain-containing protein [Penicillium alfredii]|uniref:Major facilitator superfamily domain-containing protein n=1 Tax=Penicillium alfredii TaxID=1506179 RepID=A0A9W9ELY8_9EURO|nr:major facilitator superfamily domain-containing protein [Penicillium alfredii]KAJ5084129.1 major facilitator superfamily domain-containing protein [Penicillium alfredii]
MDNQKPNAGIDLEEIGEREGYVLNDTSLIQDKGLQTTSDGTTILIPQPSSSPNDPLNWSAFRKHLILIIISYTAFLPDYGSTTGSVTLNPQGEEWKMDPNVVNHSQVGNVFMVGAAGPIVVALSAYFGRYPVLFWWMLLSLATAIWCTAALGFESFMAARILNGCFSTVAQGGGLMFIKDMFFFHEHTRKINIWSGFVILSPYMGPLFASFITNTQIWQWAFGVYTIQTGLAVIAIMLFVEETYYDRKTVQPELVPNGPRWQRMLGIQQWRTGYIKNTFTEAMMRPLVIICKPVVLISVVYYLLVFAWAVGINTTLSITLPPVYGFGPKQIGFFYFTPIVAVILGEIAGHWLHDLLAKYFARRNGGRIEPEARLLAIWFSMPLMVPGLILMGFALERHYHYMLAAFGWGLFAFGVMVLTVAINAYVLDAYPEASGEVAAWINFGRTTGGFIVSYFMVEWAQRQGTIRQMGTMCGVVVGAFLLIVVLQIWGKRMRVWAGPARFKTG